MGDRSDGERSSENEDKVIVSIDGWPTGRGEEGEGNVVDRVF